jgi:phage FluMu gp28-like protein
MEGWRKALPDREWLAVDAWAKTFHPFQRRWLFETARFAAWIKSRQIGFSHSVAGWAVLRALLGELTTIVSIGEREAGEVIEKAAKHARALQQLGSRWATIEAKSGEIRFPVSGGRILALPATSGARGYSGNVVLDEYAYTGTNAAKIWDAASAAVMHGYSLRVASTPNGAAGPFYELITNSKQNEGWTIWKTTIDEAIADGMTVDLEECWKMARHDPRTFDQLFRCSFLNSDEQYLQPHIVEPCIQPEGDVGANHWSLRGRLVYYGGIDVGLVNDNTAIVTVAQDVASNRVWIVDCRTCKRTLWNVQQALIEATCEHYGWKRCFVDRTGLGAVPVQLLKAKLGHHRIRGVPFTPANKSELASGLYQAIADGVLSVPNDRLLISDLYALKRVVMPGGGVKLDADHDANGHADRAWATALALAAVTNEIQSRSTLSYE